MSVITNEDLANEDFKAYLDKYAGQKGITKEEACKHLVVGYVANLYKEEKSK